MRKADVSDAFRNVRMDPAKAHKFSYAVGDLVVIDFRLAFGGQDHGGFGASCRPRQNVRTATPR